MACTGENRNTYRIGWGNLKERDCYEEVGVDRGAILKLILKKQGAMPWSGLIWLIIRTSDRPL